VDDNLELQNLVRAALEHKGYCKYPAFRTTHK
jgi:hypothetical protein